MDFYEANIHSFNRYAYANNNPYRYVDPDGRAPWDRNQKGVNNPFALDAGFGPGMGPGGKLDVGAGRINDNKSFSQIKTEQGQILSKEIQKGGESAAAAAGRRAHRNYENTLGGGYEFNRALPSGKRPDAIDWENRVVRELKPDNPRAINRGQKQVDGYKRELEQLTGDKWRSNVDTYKQ